MATGKEESRMEGLDQLREGRPPRDSGLLRQISAGLDSLMDFWTKTYLESYLPAGGSKIKFITGNPGSGKTHFARMLQAEAADRGFLTVSFSAKQVWLHDFREVYLEILRQCDIERVLARCADRVAREMNVDPSEIREGTNLMDLLAERGEADAFTKNAIRGTLRELFARNPLLDNTFALCCSMLVGGMLGHPVLENASRKLILAYLKGDRTVKAAQLRAIGLNPTPITKYNARHLLRSLCEVVKMAGYAGMIVTVDDMEMLMNRTAGDPIRYTKLRRDDTYESIRQLIDDIDSMRFVGFLFCFDRELMENESLGIKTYGALWMRIQNEVVSTRFNRFADIVDMDRYGDEMYSPPVLAEMSRKLSEALREASVEAKPLTEEETKELQERAVFGRLGLPYLMNRMTLEGGKDNG